MPRTISPPALPLLDQAALPARWPVVALAIATIRRHVKTLMRRIGRERSMVHSSVCVASRD
jgi:hypothetical protein